MNKTRGLMLLIAAVGSLFLLVCGNATDAEPQEVVAQIPGPRGVEVVAPATEVAPGLTVAPTETVSAPTTAVAAPASLDAIDIVAAYEEVLGGIYAAVLPSVVQVRVQRSPDTGGFSGTPQQRPFAPAVGSGFVWSPDGHVVTNHHVMEDAERVFVVFADGSQYRATVLGSDPGSTWQCSCWTAPRTDLRRWLWATATPLGSVSSPSP